MYFYKINSKSHIHTIKQFIHAPIILLTSILDANIYIYIYIYGIALQYINRTIGGAIGGREKANN